MKVNKNDAKLIAKLCFLIQEELYNLLIKLGFVGWQSMNGRMFWYERWGKYLYLFIDTPCDKFLGCWTKMTLRL